MNKKEQDALLQAKEIEINNLRKEIIKQLEAILNEKTEQNASIILNMEEHYKQIYALEQAIAIIKENIIYYYDTDGYIYKIRGVNT